MTEVYLGNPSPAIKTWIERHTKTSGRFIIPMDSEIILTSAGSEPSHTAPRIILLDKAGEVIETFTYDNLVKGTTYDNVDTVRLELERPGMPGGEIEVSADIDSITYNGLFSINQEFVWNTSESNPNAQEFHGSYINGVLSIKDYGAYGGYIYHYIFKLSGDMTLIKY